LGELSAVQRAALAAALAGKGSANEAIALVETWFAVEPACARCNSERFGSWGKPSDLKRYKCKDCNRTFNALNGTPLDQLHRRDARLDYASAAAAADEKADQGDETLSLVRGKSAGAA
jgi:transposase-like protein